MFIRGCALFCNVFSSFVSNSQKERQGRVSTTGWEEELRIKQRETYYCNVKLLLIFSVVYGHMIENIIDSIEPLMQIYRIIYSVHMPLFLFLSGLFLKSKSGCLRQAKQMLLYYGVCQSAAVLIGRMIGEKWSFTTPVWHLWYLLSLGTMACMGWCWYAITEHYIWFNNRAVKAMLLILTVCLACIAGEWNDIGRWGSLSRTICFFPYFLAGMFCPTGADWKRRGFKVAGHAGLAVYLLLYLGIGQNIPTELFYQADDYGTLGIEQGAVLRLGCMLMAVVLGLGILVLVPKKRFSFSKLGTDTLKIYLLHAPIVKLLQQMGWKVHIWIAVSPFLAVYMILLIYKLFQWKKPLYSLVTKQREQGTIH